jgi:predicted RNA-binding protein with PIN domain
MPRYFVDGYNVILSSEALSAGPLRDQRERLLRFIEDRHPQGASSNAVMVVFDGKEDVTSPAWAGMTRVVFSRGRDADTVIKDQVDSLSQPRDAVVITNDRAIQRWVRAAGAKVISCEDFLAAGSAAKRPARKPGALSPSEADAINQELKNLWKLK